MKNIKLKKLFDEVKSNDEKWEELNKGTKQLVRAYNFTTVNEDNIVDEIIIDDIIWDNERADFVKALVKYDVKELIFASTWSSAIELLTYLIDAGWKVEGTVIYKIEKGLFGNKDKEYKGLKLIRK